MSSHLRPFGMIGTSLWQSEKFQAIINLGTRLTYIWLHTSQKTCAGILRIGPAHLVEEVDFVESLEEAEAIFQQLSNVGLVEWCRPFVIIGNFLRFNPVKSYRHAIGAFNEVLALPDSEAKQKLFALLQKQKGAQDLVQWRDKSGEPHRVIFAINEYAAESDVTLSLDAEITDCVNPSETPHEPLTNPSGKSRSKSRSKSINEKVESITHPISESHQDTEVVGFRIRGANPKRSPVLASEAAKSSALARGVAS